MGPHIIFGPRPKIFLIRACFCLYKAKILSCGVRASLSIWSRRWVSLKSCAPCRCYPQSLLVNRRRVTAFLCHYYSVIFNGPSQSVTVPFIHGLFIRHLLLFCLLLSYHNHVFLSYRCYCDYMFFITSIYCIWDS